MANYDVFALGTDPSNLTLTAGEQAGSSVSNTEINDTAPGDGNPNILGDVTNDTFTLNGTTLPGANPGDTYVYIGTTTYTAHANGQLATLNAFVVQDTITHQYYMLVKHTIGYKPAINQTLTINADNPSVGSTQWNLSTNEPGCFCAGTLIATPAGQVPVESLAAGDLVLTADGPAMPVRWLGRTVVSRAFADPLRVLPVRIKAGALAENVPARDLLVSSGHAVLVDDVLVHAGALVNGSSVVRDHDAPAVFTYYHVELDTHAVLLAEGAPAESFLDGVEDMNFANWAERVPVAAEELAYPRARSARQVPRAARARLAARAASLFGAVAEAA